MASLSDAEATQYHEAGYLIPSFRLPEQRVQQLRVSLERLIRDNPEVRPEKLVSAHVLGRTARRTPRACGATRPFWIWHATPDILDLVEQVIGPDIMLWGCHVFCKPAGDGQETPWHQDGHYWPIRPLANCTVWVALDPSTSDNGCLRVIPGSHRPRQCHPHLH